MSSSSMSSDNRRCMFLELPVELRQLVYAFAIPELHLLFSDHHASRFRKWPVNFREGCALHGRGLPFSPEARALTSLMSVNKRVYLEVIDSIQDCEWHVYELASLAKLLNNAGIARSLRRVELGINYLLEYLYVVPPDLDFQADVEINKGEGLERIRSCKYDRGQLKKWSRKALGFDMIDRYEDAEDLTRHFAFEGHRYQTFCNRAAALRLELFKINILAFGQPCESGESERVEWVKRVPQILHLLPMGMAPGGTLTITIIGPTEHNHFEYSNRPDGLVLTDSFEHHSSYDEMTIDNKDWRTISMVAADNSRPDEEPSSLDEE